MNRIFIIPVMIVLLLMFACDKKIVQVPIIDPIMRLIDVGLSDMTKNSGTAPFTVEYELRILFGYYGDDSLKDRPVNKAEINFGDEGRWIDVTGDLLRKESVYELASEYTYTKPGTYTIRARVTYWDGEVLDHIFPIPIEVLPPADDGGGGA